MVNKKVFCSNCKWWYYWGGGCSGCMPGGSEYHCIHASNRYTIREYTSRSEFTRRGYHREASEINKNNDCKWYVELVDADKTIKTMMST